MLISSRLRRWVILAIAVPLFSWLLAKLADRIGRSRGDTAMTRALRASQHWRQRHRAAAERCGRATRSCCSKCRLPRERGDASALPEPRCGLQTAQERDDLAVDGDVARVEDHLVHGGVLRTQHDLVAP